MIVYSSLSSPSPSRRELMNTINRPSIAHEHFKAIVNSPDPVAHLRGFVNSNPPTFESAHLDFKGFIQLDKGGKRGPLGDAKVKEIWSQAIAAFATTSGGLLIWGIDARKLPGSEIDEASDFALVPQPFALKSRLRELEHQATDPPVPGIEIEAFPDPSEADAGFVVCYIPESPYKPHRAEMGGKRWMIRIGDDSVDTPPSVLRSLFYPHRNAYLSLKIGIRQTMAFIQMREAVEFLITPTLVNEGPATIENLVVQVRREEGKWEMAMGIPMYWEGGGAAIGWSKLYSEPIHAGQRFDLPPIQFRVLRDSQGQPVRDFDGVEFEWRLYAYDLPPVRIVLPYSRDELSGLVSKRGATEPIDIARYK
jgi:hypothetical protein